jgi:hypothetical protein
MAEPTSDGASAGSVSAPEAAEAGEPAAWAEVEARWGEPAAHRAYLARCADLAGLEGLAVAGGRYRAALAARPGDTVALGMKAEVLKRATVLGLAMLPRTPPPSPAAGKWKRITLIALTAWLGATLAFLLWKLLAGFPS